MQDRCELSKQLDNFKAVEAECFRSEDREIINSTLLHWFGTLEKFDLHVHTTVKSKVLDTIGGELHVPLKYIWPMLLLRIYHMMDNIACGFYYHVRQSEDNWLAIYFAAGTWSILVLTLYPSFILVAKLGKVAFNERWKNIILVLCMTVANFIYAFGLWFITHRVLLYQSLYVGLPFFALSCLWTAWIQRDSLPKWCCRSRKSSMCQAGAEAGV